MTFGSLDRRLIVSKFNGSEINSDTALLLLHHANKHYDQQTAVRFTDHRDLSRMENFIKAMVTQRRHCPEEKGC